MSSPATIFTTGPLGQNKRTSQQFASFGATGSPAPIAEARVTMFQTSPASYLKIWLVNTWALIAAMITNAPYTVGTTAYELPASTMSFDIFSRPPMVITISKPTEQTVSKLRAAGFAEQSNGRYKYWSGPSTDAAIAVALKEGASMDAYAPMNTLSGNGVIAFSLINRVIYYTIRILANMTKLPETFSSKAPKIADVEVSPAITEANLDGLPEKGFFFGYFDGLCLPDRASSLRILNKHFSLLFGSNHRLVETMKVLSSGWLTLNDTPAGRAISHLLFCIDHSIELGIPLRPVFLAGEYSGCVFATTTAGVIQGSTFVKPSTKDQMRAAIELMMSHDSALRSIVSIFNDMKGEEDDDYTVNQFTYARDIHNVLRELDVNGRRQQELSLAFRKLKFQESLFEVTNPRHVTIAVGLICRKEFPSRESPINLRLDAMWTKNPIYSVLAMFNVRAPSLRGKGSTLSLPLHKNMYSNLTKPGRLAGIPVFAKAHDKALEDWEGILKDKHVWFDHKGSDKFGHIRVKDVALSIILDTPDAKSIVEGLKIVSLKRQRETDEGEDQGPSPDEVDEAARVKRRKLKGYGMLGMAISLPTEGETAGDMEVDAEPDPFA